MTNFESQSPGLLKPMPKHVEGSSIACEMTAAGRGAISVIAIAGTNLLERIDRFFQAANKKPLSDQILHKPIYGYWNQEDVIFCIHGDDYGEVHCHGNAIARQRILDDLQAIDFEVRDFNELQWQNSSTASQAMRKLPNCLTVKTAAIMNWQAQGALDRALYEIETLAEQGEPTNALTNQLMRYATIGLHLTQPWTVALVGKPNVGKSSLINAIVGYDRSIVYDQPGTTRDLVTVETAIDGWPVKLVDTAGIRVTDEAIEQQGVALAEKTILEADLVLQIQDASNDQIENPLGIPTEKVITVLNKCDLLEDFAEQGTEALSITRNDRMQISALTGEGLQSLLEAISGRLVPHTLEEFQAVPFLPEHIEKLAELLQGSGE